MRQKKFDIDRFCEYVIDSDTSEEKLIENFAPGMVWDDVTPKERLIFYEKVFYCENCAKLKWVDERYSGDDGDLCERCQTEFEEDE